MIDISKPEKLKVPFSLAHGLGPIALLSLPSEVNAYFHFIIPCNSLCFYLIYIECERLSSIDVNGTDCGNLTAWI